jgi:glycosyltransferase involved in cell wall biosynthesis
VNLLIIEPFFVGSHALWADGYAAHSRHDIQILKLSGNHWKWRMHGGAVTLSRRFLDGPTDPDLIIATDMLDLTTFLSITRRRTARIPTVVYYHENQLTYPWSPKDRDLKRDRDRHYGFINFASALAADCVFFNSDYHRTSFLDALPRFLAQFPDHQELGQVDEITAKSRVLPLGLDLRWFDEMRSGWQDAHRGESKKKPLILWNHRWEYDKNPEEFFDALTGLADRGRSFDVVLLGEVFDVRPDAFLKGAADLAGRIIHSGYVEARTDYAKWLWRADILPVTSHHDFFGGSVIEAVYCGCFPLLPRRLAYPELIPDELHPLCFYDGVEELVQKLDASMVKLDDLPVGPFREAASRYDWRVMAPMYDRALEEIANSK